MRKSVYFIVDSLLIVLSIAFLILGAFLNMLVFLILAIICFFTTLTLFLLSSKRYAFVVVNFIVCLGLITATYFNFTLTQEKNAIKKQSSDIYEEYFDTDPENRSDDLIYRFNDITNKKDALSQKYMTINLVTATLVGGYLLFISISNLKEKQKQVD